MPFIQSPVYSKLSSREQLVKAGKMYAVTNPTPGTAIVSANNTSFSATANGLFVIQNNNPANSGVNIWLDQLWLEQTATAPTGTLYQRYEVYNETGLVVGTGNVATRTPVNMNPAFANGNTNAVAQSFAAGFITIPAAVGTRRLMSIFSLATGVTVLGDSFTINFGSDGPPAARVGLTAARATDLAQLVCSAPAVCITPQTTSWINMWWVTSGANVPSYEFSLTYSEFYEPVL